MRSIVRVLDLLPHLEVLDFAPPKYQRGFLMAQVGLTPLAFLLTHFCTAASWSALQCGGARTCDAEYLVVFGK